jgi:hypothetical protein
MRVVSGNSQPDYHSYFQGLKHSFNMCEALTSNRASHILTSKKRIPTMPQPVVKLIAPHEKMQQEHLSSQADRVSLQFTRKSPLFDRCDFSQLERVAALQAAVPARSPVHAGRTVYVYTEEIPDAPFADRSIKVKGAAGIRFNGETCSIVAPDAQSRYGDPAGVPHLGISPDLHIVRNFESPKGVNSLTLAGAEREFDALSQLSNIGRSFRPLFAAQRIVDDNPELDVCNRHTGITASLFGNTQEFIRDYLMFCVVEDDTSYQIVGDSELQERLGITDINHALLLFNRMAYRIGQAKIESIVSAGIMRHNGSVHNYVYDWQNKRALLTDLDSVLLRRDLQAEQHGPQLLRDLVSDTMKIVTPFTCALACPMVLDHIKKYGESAIYRVINGMFEQYAPAKTIERVAQVVTQRYLALLEQDHMLQFKRSIMAKGLREPQYLPLANLTYEAISHLLLPLHPVIFEQFYLLIKDNREFSSRGFTLPDAPVLPDQSLSSYFEQEFDRYLQTIAHKK